MDDATVLRGVTDAYLDYCEAVDEGRVEDFVALFTDDGVFDDPTPATGHAHIGKRVGRLLSGFDATSHHVSNIRVLHRDGHEARARAYVYAWHRLTDGTDFEVWGRYETTFRHDGERWRFANHQVQVAGMRPQIEGGERVTRVPRRPVGR